MFQKQQFVNVAEVPCREAAQSNEGDAPNEWPSRQFQVRTSMQATHR
jgi:hypothetical protein